MTGPEASEYRKVAVLDWQRIARAHAFYQSKGYVYVEVPWAVKAATVAATIPPDARPLCVADADAILIGSAEQGILDLIWNQGFQPEQGARYFSVSPCFRGETTLVQGVTQLTFMKVELFSLASPTAMLVLTCDAARFLTSEGGLLSRAETPEGLDLFCGGMEVGSYGTRTKFGLSWAYGTGLAEPRFSSALSQQKDKS